MKLIASIKSSLMKVPSILGPPGNTFLSIQNNFFNLTKLVLISILSFPAKKKTLSILVNNVNIHLMLGQL